MDLIITGIIGGIVGGIVGFVLLMTLAIIDMRWNIFDKVVR